MEKKEDPEELLKRLNLKENQKYGDLLQELKTGDSKEHLQINNKLICKFIKYQIIDLITKAKESGNNHATFEIFDCPAVTYEENQMIQDKNNHYTEMSEIQVRLLKRNSNNNITYSYPEVLFWNKISSGNEAAQANDQDLQKTTIFQPFFNAFEANLAIIKSDLENKGVFDTNTELFISDCNYYRDEITLTHKMHSTNNQVTEETTTLLLPWRDCIKRNLEESGVHSTTFDLEQFLKNIDSSSNDFSSTLLTSSAVFEDYLNNQQMQDIEDPFVGYCHLNAAPRDDAPRAGVPHNDPGYDSLSESDTEIG